MCVSVYEYEVSTIITVNFLLVLNPEVKVIQKVYKHFYEFLCNADGGEENSKQVSGLSSYHTKSIYNTYF